MQFELTEEQALIERTAADFAKRRLSPRAAARDIEAIFPTDEMKELADLGLLGIAVPAEHGGAGAGVVAYSLAMTEIAYGDASVAVTMSVTNMVAELVARFGTDAQREQHLAKLMGGAYLCGSFALSEPQAGSDPAALACRADRIDGGYALTGTKQWVSHGDRSGLIVVWAVTDKAAGHRGMTAFLVRKGAAGLSVSKAEKKMGLRGSTTVQLALDEVRVTDGDVLGEVGGGFKLAMVALDGGRIGIASQALGISRMAFDAAVRYARERETFGKPIIGHQAIGNMLADCATWLDAGRLLTLRAAAKKHAGVPFTHEASMAKLFCTEKASAICDAAIQVHGGYGYTEDFPVERAYRDSRVSRIYEGTSEIQRLVIARNLMKGIGL